LPGVLTGCVPFMPRAPLSFVDQLKQQGWALAAESSSLMSFRATNSGGAPAIELHTDAQTSTRK
ncbi:hypothetical protein, partial [Bradyrhizobium pachyrhizi]|uniref:hypothetical protein n=1 Tax=Bradyrhizobium pachyrhizi TaxID=280333 RepID=UPI001AEBE90C